MEEKKKSKLGLGILIGLLIAIIIGLTGFIVYDKVLNKTDEKEQSENNDKVENEITDNDINQDNSSNESDDEIVTELDLSSTLVSSLSQVFYGKFLTSGASIYDNYFYRKEKTIIANLPDKLKMVMTFYTLNNPSSVSDSKVEETYKQIFGSKAVVPNTVSLDCDFPYEHVNGFYQVPNHGLGCGGASASFTFTKLIGAKKIQNNNEEKIVISEAVAFMTDDGTTTGQNKLYNDVNFTEFVEVYKYDFINTVDQGPKNPLDDDYTKYAQYDYTFVKDEADIYVFTSVERVK